MTEGSDPARDAPRGATATAGAEGWKAGAAPDADAGAPTLLLRYWGVRGSVPAPGAATARYGGNTPCVELRTADGRLLVLDAGTGLRTLGDALLADAGAPATLHVLVTHGHADHVHGLPFFAPFARRRVALVLYTSAGCAEGVRGGVRALLQPPLFPEADGLVDRLPVHVLADAGETEVAGFAVRAVSMAHPGGACGFVVRDPAGGHQVAYLPDNELAVLEGEARRALVEALRGVDVLLHDAMYLPSELPTHYGWGHSSYAESVRLAADAGARRLVLFHHHPARDDDALDRIAYAARKLAEAPGGGPEVTVAAEGATLALAAR